MLRLLWFQSKFFDQLFPFGHLAGERFRKLFRGAGDDGEAGEFVTLPLINVASRLGSGSAQTTRQAQDCGARDDLLGGMSLLKSVKIS